MKATKRNLWLSAVSIMLCVVLLLGTTFAWFTDSVTNKGNVIQAGALNIGFQYRALETTDDDNLPYVDVTDETPLFDDVTWEPGKSFGYDFKISNEGTLAIKWELSIQNISATSENGVDISDMLDVYFMNDENAMDLSNATNKGTLASLQDGIITTGNFKANAGDYKFSVVIKMKEDAKNEYQNASVTFDIYLRAKQATVEEDGFGNSNYDQDAEYDPIQVGSTSDALVEAVESAQPGDVLELPAVTYVLDEPLVIPNGVTLKGAQAGKAASEWVNDDNAEKTIIQAPANSDRVIKIEQTEETEAISNVVLDGILVDGNNENTKGIFVKKLSGDAMTGIVIQNCAVIDCGNDGIDVNNTNGAIIENNYVDGIYDNGIQLTSYKNDEGVTSYIRNNVVKNVGNDNSGTINGAIAVSGGKGDVVVTGNTIENVKSQKQAGTSAVDMGESAIVVESVNEGGVITIENNMLKTVEQGIAVYKFSALTETDKVIIRNNTVEDANTFAIATSTLNYAKTNATSVVEISENSFVGTAPVKDYIYVEKTNRYNETTTGWQVVASGNTSGNGTYNP